MKINTMTWEETIKYIRTQPEYQYLVEKAYFEEDLPLNVERFKASEEFIETLQLIKKYQPQGKKLLDIGCGNGISSIAFALNNYQVTAVEPDPSQTIGAGAIRQLVKHYNLSNVQVHEAFAEEIQFPPASFDIVYIRQAMHHAHDLDKFIGECGRVLKKGGLLITVRDHVVFNEKDKAWFLETHPLQKFYGGENAFSPQEYKNAMQKAGLGIVSELKFYDSVINFFPATTRQIKEQVFVERKAIFKRKTGILSYLPWGFSLFNLYLDKKVGNSGTLDDSLVPGRMYSYLAIKK